MYFRTKNEIENDPEAKQYHMISAKRMGWDGMYDYYPFPADMYTESDAMAQFVPVQKEALKNDHWVEYTAYEFQGETYYEVLYMGIYSEDDIMGNYGFTKDELDFF